MIMSYVAIVAHTDVPPKGDVSIEKVKELVQSGKVLSVAHVLDEDMDSLRFWAGKIAGANPCTPMVLKDEFIV